MAIVLSTQSAQGIETTPQVQTLSSGPSTNPSQAERVHQLVILDDDRNLLKGILWGWLGLDCGGAAIACGAATVVSGFAAVASTGATDMSMTLWLSSVGTGILTFVLGSCTMQCASNCFYHFGSRQVKVIQFSN